MSNGKIAIFSDAHAHPWPAFANFNDQGLNTRLVEVCNIIHYILSEAEKEKCAAVLFCGDMFHTKKIDIETIDHVVSTLKKTSIPIIMIAGNHDSADKLAQFTSIKALAGRAQILDWESDGVNVGGYRVVGMPYVGHDFDGHLSERIEDCGEPDILMLHAPVEDALMGSDFVTPEGYGVSQEKLLNESPLTLVGHYHNSQLYRKGQDPQIPAQDGDVYKVSDRTVLIPGSPLQHNLSDLDTVRGFWIYDGKSLTFRDSNAPRFVVLTEKELESMDSNEYSMFIKNNYVTIQADDRVKADQLVKSIKGARGVQSSVSGTTKRELKERINFKDKTDYKGNIKQYCEAMKTSKDIEELGVKLYEEILRSETL